MYKKNIIILLCFQFGFYLSLLAEKVEIKGIVPDYANTELVFNQLSDPFTQTPLKLASTVINDKGEFKIELELDSICQIFTDVGIYRGSMFLVPGNTYNISFPARKDKTKAEMLNPFFEPVEFYIPIENITPDDLNFKIIAFNNAYLPYLEKFSLNIRVRNKTAMFDSAVVALKKTINDSDRFFQDYVKYKIGYLKHLAFQQKTKSISKEYFQTNPVLLNNPAYIELFNQVYNRYFYFFARSSYGKKIYNDINVDKSYSKMVATLKSDSVLLSDSLRELVILKNIHDEFYAANFSRAGLLEILDSLIHNTHISKTRDFATFIREKITRLMPGFVPPTFELTDKEGKKYTLSDFAGSYVYMGFCTSSSYSCLKEFDALNRMYEKYKDKKILIVTISNDDNWEAMVEFVNKSGYPWLFLYAGDSAEMLAKYDIRAYPTYFLIGPDSKLIFSPAISPSEGFELKLFQVMRAKGDI